MGPHRWSIHCSQARVRWRRCVTRSESPSRGSAQVMPRRRITRPMRTSRSPTTSTTFGPSGVSSTHSRVAPWLESRRATRPSRSPRIPDVLVRLRQRRHRGPAMSTVIGLNTMASVVGVPLAGIVAEGTTWRASVAIVGLLSIAAALLLLWKLRPAQVPVSESKVRELYGSILTNRSAVGAIGSSLLGSLYWFTWSTYIVVFFELTFQLSEGIASTIALTLGLGVLVGSQFGGRLGTRIGHKPIVAASVVISGALLLLQTHMTLPLAATAALNFVLSAVIGARFASNTTLLTEQVPEARGTLLALSASVTSLSIVAGAAIGGLLIDGPGFPAVGVFCFVAAVLAASVVALFVREEPIDLEIAPAA